MSVSHYGVFIRLINGAQLAKQSGVNWKWGEWLWNVWYIYIIHILIMFIYSKMFFCKMMLQFSNIN